MSMRAIAEELRRSPNTVSRELRLLRNIPYRPDKAHIRAYHKRYHSKRLCLKVALDGELTALVFEKLVLKWSPERIAGYARRQGKIVSKKAIYRFVKSRFLERHLLWKGSRNMDAHNGDEISGSAMHSNGR
jgi:IS30 family transposase